MAGVKYWLWHLLLMFPCPSITCKILLLGSCGELLLLWLARSRGFS